MKIYAVVWFNEFLTDEQCWAGTSYEDGYVGGGHVTAVGQLDWWNTLDKYAEKVIINAVVAP